MKSLNHLLPWWKDNLNYELANVWEFSGWSRYNPETKREEFFLIHRSGVGLWTWKWH